MSCNHPEQPGHAFCAFCGARLPHQRCRCGFVCSLAAAFCGRCGGSLAAAGDPDGATVTAGGAPVDGKHDLREFLGLACQAPQPAAGPTAKALSQDEIKALLKRKARKA